MLTKSDLKLEKEWERKRRERGYAHGYILEVPADMADMKYRGLERPPRLRAIDFVQELERLALEWGDRRFAHAVRAVRELGILNKRGGFSKKRGPHATSLKASALDYAVAKVWALRDRNPNLSEWKACALVAEDLVWGLPASRLRSNSCDKPRRRAKTHKGKPAKPGYAGARHVLQDAQ
jgi:hypothetical protein